ncbi:hypothetical protein BGZ65_011696 [Modicella reniformis]|uniref:Uncharacterized protein n=1 Tax=Modicella reniformis TaxID=1440133 RepID=A0A9P6IHN0_9FUNG|nr:hypothetical protein BGZ65_011696 [Modicella reniformis]
MRSNSFVLLVACLVALVAVSAQQQPETALPCFQEKCVPLVNVLQECQITVELSTGKITYPVVANTTTTDQCLCRQPIVNAYDPCFICGQMDERFSTQKLVDSCNINFGANTVKMPSSAAASATIRGGSLALAAASIVFSVIFLA